MLIAQAHPEMSVFLNHEWAEGNAPGGIEGAVEIIADPFFELCAFGAECDAVIHRLAVEASMVVGGVRDGDDAEVEEIEGVKPGGAAKIEIDGSANFEDLSAVVGVE